MILLKLFLTFFKVGLFSFGGGLSMMPLIEAEVTKAGWLTSEALVDLIAVSESTPGPFAVNISTFVGAETAGIPGAVAATCGVVLPSFVVILLAARFYTKFQKNRWVKGGMRGLTPAVVGLIGAALLSVILTVFFPAGLQLSVFSTPGFYLTLGIFLICAFLAFKKLHPIYIILLSAVLGVAVGYGFGL